jgi:hypothetical protein
VGRLSRREFLKLSAIGGPTLAALQSLSFRKAPDLPLGRVAVKSIDIYKKPDFDSPSAAQLKKDTIVPITGVAVAEGPYGNPRWLEVEEGYIHSGDIQIVEFHPQVPVQRIYAPTLVEVSVPITQSYIMIEPEEKILYRLYYQSLFWMTGVFIGKEEKVWYKLHDQQLGVDLFAPGEHLRLVGANEYMPLSPDVNPGKKWIEIQIAPQTLTAYEDSAAVHTANISSGMLFSKEYATPNGTYHIQNKTASVHMGNGQLTADPLAYELPGVPWVSYFEMDKGIALHGTFWHNDFGRVRSHGCINLPPADALWIYRWTTPSDPDPVAKGINGYGTMVIID